MEYDPVGIWALNAIIFSIVWFYRTHMLFEYSISPDAPWNEETRIKEQNIIINAANRRATIPNAVRWYAIGGQLIFWYTIVVLFEVIFTGDIAIQSGIALAAALVICGISKISMS